MDLIPANEIFQSDKRNTKKTILPTDAICIRCGVIFNSVYEDQCVICDDTEERCLHEEFITGIESVDLRILLDYHMEDLRALAELHGVEGGSRGKMTIRIMEKLHSSLDKRINENLVRKMIKRNSKKFRFWKNIEDAILKAKKSKGITLISAEDCIEITEFEKGKK